MAKYHVYSGEGDVRHLDAVDRVQALEAYTAVRGKNVTLWERTGDTARLIAGRMGEPALVVGTPDSTVFVSKLLEPGDRRRPGTR